MLNATTTGDKKMPKFNTLKRYPLINVTAITSAGSPITTQMWQGSLAEVQRRVKVWQKDCSSDHQNIIRVFTQIIDDERGSSTIEWKWWGGSENLEYLDTLDVYSKEE